MARSDSTLTPSQLNALARDLLEGSFPAVLVEGEIGNLARPASGHIYFTLKDARAAVRCALFKPKSQWLKFVPKEGMQVLARGRLTLYEPRGDYQLLLDSMEEAGEGALRRAFEVLKTKLAGEGLFDTARKRALPAFPRRLGVLTSASGAVIRDIVSVLGRRFPLVEVDLLPVPVQGAGAAAQIRAMLARADASGRYDVLVLARGGGSLEDLWAFNDEALARAIAACTTPVVSAVGHETDFTLADFAADLRAPTPSAAAELLVPDATELSARLASALRRLQGLADTGLRTRAQRADHAFLRLHALRPQARLEAQRQHLAHVRHRLIGATAQRLQHATASLLALAARLRTNHPRHRVERLCERLHSLAARLQANHPRHCTAQARERLRALAARLRANHPRQRVERARERAQALIDRQRARIAQRLHNDALKLGGLGRSMHAISPLATIARGYAILQREDGRIVRTVDDAPAGAPLHARVGDGSLRLRVTGSGDRE